MSETAVEFSSQENSDSLQKRFFIGAKVQLSLTDIRLLSKQAIPIALSPESYVIMQRSHVFLNDCVAQRLPIYGINTNFGDQVGFIDENINNDDEKKYYDSINSRQENIIKSLACGLGDIVPAETVKAAMILRAHCLSQGYSGVAPDTIETILAFINAGITPIIRHYGSIGASGDLIPLSTIAAALIGEDVDVMYCGQVVKAPEAIQKAGLKKVTPELRDGLAMINGTSFMTAIASLALMRLNRLYQQMLAAIAMSLESMLVITSAYHPLVHQLKNQSGECAVNDFLVSFWKNSQLLSDLDEVRKTNRHGESGTVAGSKHVQDFYSIRSVAQGFGAFHENLLRATMWIENEMNSVNDNPIIDPEQQKIHHSANFMGYYVTSACDILKMDIAQASTWLHAILANMIHPRKNHNLPANLVNNPGKNNGFRSMQLLATALTVQNRKLAQSHQAFTLPTEGDNQDVNSLGTHAAFDLQEAVANLERLTAIMLLASTQALELRGIEKAGDQSKSIHQLIRQHFSFVTDCRPMSDEVQTIVNLLAKGAI